MRQETDEIQYGGASKKVNLLSENLYVASLERTLDSQALRLSMNTLCNVRV